MEAERELQETRRELQEARFKKIEDLLESLAQSINKGAMGGASSGVSENEDLAVIRRFQPSMMQNPFELLLGLKQTTTVEDFRAKFELYAGPLRGTDQEYLKGIFLNGLREEVKAELKLHPAGTLAELMNNAQMIDEKNQALVR
ncbi:Retrotransposable element Tf2 [Sesbania bispinosa]|nr:Retrotransposable element Tf2 [Sesbania bispinosa]